MSRLTNRFTSFLDRFEEQLQVDCEQTKRQLVDRVDQQFGVLRSKLTELRNCFGGSQARSARSLNLGLDDPPVEIVSLDKWTQEQRYAASAAADHQNSPSTSNGRKRIESQSGSGTARKRQKTQPNGPQQFVYKFEGCGQSFAANAFLVRHERIHLGVKPFKCTWNNCSYCSEQRGPVLNHIRSKHFKLPPSVKEQQRLNIIDDRNPNDFIQVDVDLLARRLQ